MNYNSRVVLSINIVAQNILNKMLCRWTVYLTLKLNIFRNLDCIFTPNSKVLRPVLSVLFVPGAFNFLNWLLKSRYWFKV